MKEAKYGDMRFKEEDGRFYFFTKDGWKIIESTLTPREEKIQKLANEILETLK